eukprot:scaffold131865_cov87-Phaeocystis_antarctica.AAC.7
MKNGLVSVSNATSQVPASNSRSKVAPHPISAWAAAGWAPTKEVEAEAGVHAGDGEGQAAPLGQPQRALHPQVRDADAVAEHAGEEEREREGHRDGVVEATLLAAEHGEEPAPVEEWRRELGEGEPREGQLEVPAVEHAVRDGDEERVVHNRGVVLVRGEVPHAPQPVPLQVAHEDRGEGDGVRPAAGRRDPPLGPAVRPLGEAQQAAHDEHQRVRGREHAGAPRGGVDRTQPARGRHPQPAEAHQCVQRAGNERGAEDELLARWLLQPRERQQQTRHGAHRQRGRTEVDRQARRRGRGRLGVLRSRPHRGGDGGGGGVGGLRARHVHGRGDVGEVEIDEARHRDAPGVEVVRLERARCRAEEREERGVWQHAQRNEGEPRRRPQLGARRAPRVERHRTQPQQRRVPLAQLHHTHEQQVLAVGERRRLADERRRPVEHLPVARAPLARRLPRVHGGEAGADAHQRLGAEGERRRRGRREQQPREALHRGRRVGAGDGGEEQEGERGERGEELGGVRHEVARARVREAEAAAQREARDVRDGHRRGHGDHLRLVGAEDERQPEPHEQQHACEGVADGRGAGVGRRRRADVL